MKSAIIIVILIIGVMTAACSSDSKPRYIDECYYDHCGEGVECGLCHPLANMELAVAAFMTAPDMPIRDLTNDHRIASITQCGTVASFSDCTQHVKKLITNSPGSEVQPLTDFMNKYDGNTFDNLKYWYCVYPGGRLVGFTDDGINIKDL